LSGGRKTQLHFVLDASVALRWALADESAADLRYADQVLGSLTSSRAEVPHLWHTEIAQVLGGAARRGLMSDEQCAAALLRINGLPIALDEASPPFTQPDVVRLMLALNTSGYDSQYLELATRLRLPLATLDLVLRKTSKKLGVSLYLG
jgi:predicted nucleic acid-binding protein